MKEWFIYSMITLVFWGLCDFFPKMASLHIRDPYTILVFEILGVMLNGIIIFFVFGINMEYNPKGLIYAALVGICGTVGLLFFFFALSKGKTSVVIGLTALYPLIAIVLCFIILKEPITMKQGIGILFALLAMILFLL